MFSGGNHVCVVTADLDRAVRTWADRYGVGPWHVYAFDASSMTARERGDETAFAMRAALCTLDNGFRLEIIQPHDDRSPYARSLVEHGGADHLHHVRLDVRDFGKASERLDGLGLPRVLDARFQGASEGDVAHARYFDTTEDLGFLVEIASMHEGFAMHAPEYVYPPQP